MVPLSWLLILAIIVLLEVTCETRANDGFIGYNYLSTNTTMSDLKILLDMLENRIPFGFAHFNDGEITALETTHNNSGVDFGWQHTSPQLAEAMRNAMTNTAPNFYVGIPCICEHGGYYSMKALVALKVAARTQHMFIAEGDPISHQWGAGGRLCSDQLPVFNYSLSVNKHLANGRLTVSNVFINGNYEYAMGKLSKIFQQTAGVGQARRRIHVVVNTNANISALPFPVDQVQRIPQQHAFDSEYLSLRSGGDFLHHATKDDIVLLMAGPLGRILASEWCNLRHDITIIDMGSFWDKLLWKREGHTLGKRRPCMNHADVSVVH